MPALHGKTAANALEPERRAVAHPEAFVPLRILQNAFRFWGVLFLMGLLGGLLGLGVHAARPPVVEALVVFPAGIDYVSTGPLREADVDIALNSIGKLLVSNGVVEPVARMAGQEGIVITPGQLRRSAVIERRMNTWELRLRGTEPSQVRRLAELWAAQGQAALAESFQHALEAERLNRSLSALESCLEKAVTVDPAPVGCSPSRFPEIQAELQAAGEAYKREKLASQGLFSGLVIGPADTTQIAPRAVILGRAPVLLAGVLLGFLLGLALVESGLLERWQSRRRSRASRP